MIRLNTTLKLWSLYAEERYFEITSHDLGEGLVITNNTIHFNIVIYISKKILLPLD